jgi:hypothetical protein
MRPQIVHHFEHGLVDKVCVRTFESFIFRLGQPPLNDGLELLRCHTCVGDRDDPHPVLLGELGHSFPIAGKHRLERFLLLPFRVLGCKDAFGKGDLREESLHRAMLCALLQAPAWQASHFVLIIIFKGL